MIQLCNKIQYPISSLTNTFLSFISSVAATERLMENEYNHWRKLKDGILCEIGKSFSLEIVDTVN